ncbi:light-harvesting protein [Thiorhodococcus minor]|uniref:Light-harvesting protein n=1 Tax=Thiorhodococcus minor TaxID=57489 RepID=A0A6M0K642_9GAMM|nr:light-harvesting antenna LH1, alpha subunit [Thiorhodococcus minor]NEV64781.1 light-harvesting protein [Thiorhodococcus minor]
MEVMGYKPIEQDYRIWMVVNPATWLMPILFAVLLIVLTVHVAVLSLGWFTWG